MADELVPADPLPIPTLVFPSPTEVAAAEANKQADAQQVQQASNALKIEEFLEKAHDPLGAILEKNVTETRDALVEAAKPILIEPYTKPTKYYIPQPSVAAVHAVLKNHGMDSQQAEKALKLIRDIIEGV